MPKLKILIDNSVPYLSENSDEISSTNVYLFNIIKNLSENFDDIDIIVLTNWKSYIDKFNSFKNTKVIYSKVRNPLLWVNFVVPFYSIKNKVDIIFYWKSSCCFFPIFWKKIITTVHWLIYKIMPETSSKLENIYWRIMAKISYIISKKVIVVSDTDYKDLLEDWCKESKLEKIYIWLDKKYFSWIYDKKFLEKYSLEEKKYFLQIWWVSKKKNQKFTLEVLENYLKENKDFKLVFVWPVLDHKYFLELKNIINEKKLDKQIVFTKWINQNIEFDFFISLLKWAKIFYFPSIYEWFWIPPLEAISQEVPSLISNKWSLSEIYWSDNVLELDKQIWIEMTNKILNNPEFENNFLSNQRKILNKYKWENIIKKYYNLFIKYKK